MLQKFKTNKRLLLAATLMTGLLSASGAQAEIDSIHFLIPGGAGGGWDVLARRCECDERGLPDQVPR